MLDCETASKQIIPAIRFSVARILVEERGISQSEAARILGIKQASISKYLTQKRSATVVALERKIANAGIAKSIATLAMKSGKTDAVSQAIERAASSKEAASLVLSTKALQNLPKK